MTDTLTPESLAEIVGQAIELALSPILARMAALETRAPVPGRDGRDGLPGPTGPHGHDGAPGAEGTPGRDGSLEGLVVSSDGHRAITFARASGEVLGTVRVPVVLDRGVFKAGDVYEHGDAVSHNGSLWIAQTTPPAGIPGEPGSGWRLSVKAGKR